MGDIPTVVWVCVCVLLVTGSTYLWATVNKHMDVKRIEIVSKSATR